MVSQEKCKIYTSSNLVLVKTMFYCLMLLFFLQWRYCIRLENMGSEVVQLRERHWRIFSLSGTLETVRGRGVVGRVSAQHIFTLNFVADTKIVFHVLIPCNGSLQEPVLSKEQPAFQYSSHVSLQAPSGHMWYVLNLFYHHGSYQIPNVGLYATVDFVSIVNIVCLMYESAVVNIINNLWHLGI